MAEEEDAAEEEVEAAGERASPIPEVAEDGDLGEAPLADGVSGRWLASALV